MAKYVFDIESDGLLDTITTIWCLVLQDVDTGEQYAYSDYDDSLPSLRDGLDRLVAADLIIGHNIIGYDIPAIEKVTDYALLDKHCHDTLTLSMALQYKRGHKHGLAGWGEALGNDKLDYHDWSGYNRDMLDYCRQDVRLNADVYKRLLGEYSRVYRLNPLIQRGLQVEHSVAKANTIMRTQGWNFDVKRAEFVRAKFTERMMQIESVLEPKLGDQTVYIDKEPKTPKFKKDGTYNATTCRILSDYFGYDVKPSDVHLMPAGTPFQRQKKEPIALGQQQLLKEWLLANGWKPDDWTKKRTPEGGWMHVSPKLTESSLKAFGKDGEMISEYYTLRNRLAVVEGWLEKVKDGRLHGNMWTIGTPSFRCRHEVIVNLPAVSASYGKDLRELFLADEGEVIVGCDSAGNQLRGLCHFVGNAEFTNEVINGDQHQRNADALGCSRSVAKSYLYAYLFGAGTQKLGNVLGYKGKDANTKGAQSKEDFARSIQGLTALKDKIEGEWAENEARQNVGWFKGLDGRPVFCESSHQALNYLLQSTEGITCKAAVAYAMDKVREEGLRANPRIFYHDEMAWTCHQDDSERLAEILKEAFSEAPKWFGVECMDGGDSVIGGSYADVH